MNKVHPRSTLRTGLKGLWAGSCALVLAANLLPLSAHAVTSQHPCDSVIFSAVTIDHSRQVRICASRGRIAYTYGKIGDASGLDFITSSSNATWSSYTGSVWGETLPSGNQTTVNKVSFTITGPQYVYNVQAGNDETGRRIDNIKVYSPSGRQTAEMRLDPATTVSRISDGLERFGVKRTETDRYESK